jgi:hypothetical protein
MKKLILTAVAAVLPILSVLPAFAQTPAAGGAAKTTAPIVKTHKKACKISKKHCMKAKTKKASLKKASKNATKIVASKPANKVSKKLTHKA